MLQFDAETTRLLENAYEGTDVVKRRLANLDALAPQSGETVLDIGSGPGHLMLELARAVGDAGEVIGIDPSPEMRKAAARRCEACRNVRIHEGKAGDLPLNDSSASRAISIQVFEYLDDITSALIEIRRVLRPGGRLVVGDNHWDSWVWHSDDPARMSTMMDAWDNHLSERSVPAKLPNMMRRAGYTVEAVIPLVVLDTVFRNDGLATMLLHLMQAYALQNSLVDEPTVRAWADEQRSLAAEGRFCFALTHFIVSGHRD